MTAFRKGERAMSKRPGASEQVKRQAARAQSSSPQRKSIAGGRWRSGPQKTADRKRNADRIDSFDRDDRGESPDC